MNYWLEQINCPEIDREILTDLQENAKIPFWDFETALAETIREKYGKDVKILKVEQLPIGTAISCK